MSSHYDKAKNLLRDNAPYRSKEERLLEAGVLASLAVADEVRLLRNDLAAGKVMVRDAHIERTSEG